MQLNQLAFLTLCVYTSIKRRISTLTSRNYYAKVKHVQIFYNMIKAQFPIRHSSKGRCYS